MTALFYLGGDSYPSEADFESRFTQRVTDDLGVQVISQTSFFCADELTQGGGRSIAERLTRLDALVGLFSEPVVLVGRSSGARIASLYAHDHPVSGVVCLAYPFQPKDAAPDPDRYAHLADMKTPTLILQGIKDRYGSSEIREHYPLSQAVKLVMIDADHEYQLAPAVFEEVLGKIYSFLGALKSRELGSGLAF